MSSIQGKVVVITGASSGIGEATARLLASQGAHVVIGARRLERLETVASVIRSEGGSVVSHRLDVTELEQMQEIIQLAMKQFGRLDVVVNNAGVMPLSPLAALKIDEWNRMIDVNMRGVLHGIAAGLPIMTEQGFGQFVNIASTAAYTAGPTTAVYSATKYAVRALTGALRQEVGQQHIRVTLVSPGVTESELAENISDEATKQYVVNVYRSQIIPASAIAGAIAYAIAQPEDVDVNELVIGPTAHIS